MSNPIQISAAAETSRRNEPNSNVPEEMERLFANVKEDMERLTESIARIKTFADQLSRRPDVSWGNEGIEAEKTNVSLPRSRTLSYQISRRREEDIYAPQSSPVSSPVGSP